MCFSVQLSWENGFKLMKVCCDNVVQVSTLGVGWASRAIDGRKDTMMHSHYKADGYPDGGTLPWWQVCAWLCFGVSV